MNTEKTVKYIDYYDGKIEKEDVLPNQTKYDFLLSRNEAYMDYTALSFYDRKVTYKELHIKIDEYARTLYSLGIHQGEKVGVCLLNTPEGVYTLYALDKLGAIIVGLSPLNNIYKMSRDIKLSMPKYLVYAEPLKDCIECACMEASCMPDKYILPIVKTEKVSNENNNEENNLIYLVEKRKDSPVVYGKYVPDALADILFTGGSTGTHKGVELTGNGVNCIVKALDHIFVLQPGMIHLGNIPMAHMAFGRMVLHYALCSNLEYALTLEALPNHFYSELVRTQAHGAMGGPVHWEAMIGDEDIKEGSLSNLIQAFSGGEHFKSENRNTVNKILKDAGCTVGVGDGFGLTETWAPTHICIYGKNSDETIGYPIPFVEAKIIEEKTGKEVDNGNEGLLLISSPGLMLGYYENMEETNKVICKDENGKRWYNTGDIAFKNKLGEYCFIGRRKRNFVCGVDNIYPEQIEALLLHIVDIAEIAVTKVPDKKMQFLPKYHIVLKNNCVDKEQLERQITEIIENTLGKSSCPGYICYREEPLPRTDNGKVNTIALEQEA